MKKKEWLKIYKKKKKKKKNKKLTKIKIQNYTFSIPSVSTHFMQFQQFRTFLFNVYNNVFQQRLSTVRSCLCQFH